MELSYGKVGSFLFFLPFRRFGFNKEGGSANGNVNAERGKRKG